MSEPTVQSDVSSSVSDAASSASEQAPAVSISYSPAAELLERGALGPPPRPGLLAGLDRFEILRLLGKGGMSIVLLARDGGPQGALVAIKLLKPELASQPRAVHRFLTEARHMQRLSHPNILRVIDVSDRPEGPYFALPYMPKGNLAQQLRPGVPMEVNAIERIAHDVASALAHAHAKGITHRDLKPANVLVDEQGHALLADFGLGRTVYNDSIVDVQRCPTEGTPAYMAPEIARGDAGDGRCDIYSFGAMLYEMLTGQPPYDGDTSQQVIEQVRRGAPVPILQRNPEAAEELTRIAERAMARELRDRYASMEDVLRDLNAMESPQKPIAAGHIRRSSRLAIKSAIAAVVVLGSAALLYFVIKPASPLKWVRDVPLESILVPTDAKIGDFNADGEPDLFYEDQNNLLMIYTADGMLLDYRKFPDPKQTNLAMPLVQDVNLDGKDEMFVDWSEGADLYAAVINQNFYAVRRFAAKGIAPFEHAAGHFSTSTLQPELVVDLNADGKLELLAVINTGYGLAPRAILCFDFESKKLLWQQLISSTPTHPVAIDLDRDGNKEIYLGSAAVSNGNKLPDGTNDTRCYVHAFSHDGRPLWNRELGGVYHTAHCLASEVNGQPALIVWVQTHARTSTTGGQVVRFDARGNLTATYRPGEHLLSASPGKGSFAPSVIVTDDRGFVNVLDSNLKVARRAQLVRPKFDEVDLNIQHQADIDRDGDTELLITSRYLQFISGSNPGLVQGESNVTHLHDNDLLVIDDQLEVIARYRLADKLKQYLQPKILIANPSSNEPTRLLCLVDRAVLLEWKGK